LKDNDIFNILNKIDLKTLSAKDCKPKRSDDFTGVCLDYK
jgi:hypothetical protein